MDNNDEFNFSFDKDERIESSANTIVFFAVACIVLVAIVILVAGLWTNPEKDASTAGSSSTSSPITTSPANVQKSPVARQPVPISTEKPSVKEQRVAQLYSDEKSSDEINTVKFDMRNSGYKILTAIDDGIIKDGMTLAEVEKLVPDAFTAQDGTGMAIVYNSSDPSVLSFCGWPNNTSSISDSILYDARADSFAPYTSSCLNNPYIDAVKMDLNVVENPIKGTLPTSFSQPRQQTTSPESTKPANDVGTPTVAPKAPQKPQEPISIPWNTVIIIALILLGLAALMTLWFVFQKLSRKIKVNDQQRKNNLRAWKELIQRFDTISKQWSSYELDTVKILDFPLMSDMREQATVNFHDALQKAKHLKPIDVKKVSEVQAFHSPFSHAVDTLESTFRIAESEAKRLRWTNFSTDERKRLQRAKDLLNLAMNEASSDNERQSAYKRMQKELEGLILIPEANILMLEKSINLMLTDGK